VAALEAGDIALAETLMAEHIGTVQAALKPVASSDPLEHLRQALSPVAKASDPASVSPAPGAAAPDSVPEIPSTYLGALL